MKRKTRQTLLMTLGAVVLVAATAAASTYVVRQDQVKKPEAVAIHKSPVKKSNEITWDKSAPQRPVQQPQQQRVATNCDDGNIVGTVAGGAAGGIIGSTIGKGNGKTAATIGGTLGGAYLGNQYMPTRNVTCR